MQRFNFTWYAKQDKIERHTKVQTNVADSAELSIGAKAATDLLSRTLGNLNKNEIVSIQQIDKDGNPIGEPILPMEGSSIVPIAK